MSSLDKTLVTGAAGFLGGWIVEALYLSKIPVRAGIRSNVSAARLSRLQADVVPCDVLDLRQLREAMDGVSNVVHCAIGGRDVTVKGTANVVEIAKEKGVGCVVHISSTEVYGDVNGLVEEKQPPGSPTSDYARDKMDAEQICRRHIADGVPIVILRPSIIYGPFSNDWTARLAMCLQSGNWALFEGYGDGYCNLVYVVDVVHCIRLAMRCKAAHGHTFNVSGPEIVTWNEYFSRMNSALGLPALKTRRLAQSRILSSVMAPVKLSAKWALSFFGEPIHRLYESSQTARTLMQRAEKTIKTTPTLAELELYNRRNKYSTEKARSILGYKPQWGIDAGIQMSVAWLRTMGLAYRSPGAIDVQMNA
jgi:nucleoside-diphosphate-sugar epimerase